ncbi:MAG: tetratricopeptide repeat protein [Xenococcus sp. (in: cyanobacteria)]
MESKNLQERQMGVAFVRWEYENLYQALQICLERQEGILILYSCFNTYLSSINDKKIKLQLTQSIYNSLCNYELEKQNKEWELAIIEVLNSCARCYLLYKDYQAAKEIYNQTLHQIQQLKEIEPKLKQILLAGSYNDLGSVAEGSRQFGQAQDYYQQALKIYIEYDEHDRKAQIYHQLGIIAQQLWQFEQAQDYYQQALKIYIEYDEHYEQADTLHQLGTIAQQLGQLQQAKDYYKQALSIFIEYDKHYEQAGTLHQLGILSQELGEYEKAQNYYQQALAIYIEYRDSYSQARIYGALATLAQESKEYEQAQDYYQQALDIYIEYNVRIFQPRIYYNLGGMAEDLLEFEQAKNYYLQALRMFIELQDKQFSGLTIRTLISLSRKTKDDNLSTELTAMFNMLNITKAEAKELFDCASARDLITRKFLF